MQVLLDLSCPFVDGGLLDADWVLWASERGLEWLDGTAGTGVCVWGGYVGGGGGLC